MSDYESILQEKRDEQARIALEIEQLETKAARLAEARENVEQIRLEALLAKTNAAQSATTTQSAHQQAQEKQQAQQREREREANLRDYARQF